MVCLVAPLLQWLLCLRLGWGYLGAAWAASAYNCMYPLLQAPYLARLGHRRLFVPRADVFASDGMREYLRLAAPGFLMVCGEWWVLEFMVLASGWLHPASLTCSPRSSWMRRCLSGFRHLWSFLSSAEKCFRSWGLAG